MKVQVKKRAEHESFIDIFFHVTWHDRSNVFMWNSTANAMINVGRYVLWKKVRLVFLDRPFPIFRRSTTLSLWITLISTTFRIWNALTKKKLDLYRLPNWTSVVHSSLLDFIIGQTRTNVICLLGKHSQQIIVDS